MEENEFPDSAGEQAIIECKKYFAAQGLEPDTIPLENVGDFSAACPNAKGAESIESRINRDIEWYKNDNKEQPKLDLSHRIQDMARASIILNSFSEAPALLSLLKDKIPELIGRMAEPKSGYKAIHLNFTVNGINTEIQIHTKKSWPAKVVSEINYTKWRDKKIIDAKEYKILQNKTELSAAEQEQINNFEMNAQDDAVSKNMFDTVHSDGDFVNARENIKKILDSYNLQKQQNNIDDITNDTELTQLLNQEIPLGTDGKIDHDTVLNLVGTLQQYSKPVQEKLVKNIKQVLAEISAVKDTETDREL